MATLIKYAVPGGDTPEVSLSTPLPVTTATGSPTKIDSAEWTQGTVTNYDISGQSTLFKNCPAPTHIIVRTDAAITIKFNATSEPAISIGANTSFELSLAFTKAFITTSGTSNIKVIFTQY